MTKTERDLTDGRRHHEAGEFVKAEAIYRRVLKREPRNIHARFFLGALMTQTGRNDEAVTLLREVVEERTDWEEAQNNLAVALQNAGRHADALVHFQVAAELNPDLFEAHKNMAFLQLELHQYASALKAADRALELRPKSFDALFARAEILKSLDREDEAREFYLAAAEHLPHDAESRMKLGLKFFQMEEHQTAMKIFKSVMTDFPDYAPGYNSYSAALERTATQFNRREIHQEMLSLLDKSLALDPGYIDAIVNRGTTLLKLRRTAEARDVFDSILPKVQHRYDVHNNYSAVLQEFGDYEGAIESCKRAISLNAKFAEPYYNWGACLHLMGNDKEAFEKYAMALKRDPNHVDTHSAIALASLMDGDFEQGWAEYEWRKKTSQFSGRLLGDNHLFNPNTCRGKRVLIHAEQGQGDVFQFVRFAHAVKQLGGETFLDVHDGLREIVKTCPWVDVVRERSDPEDLVFDQQANMMSLPHLLGTRPETIPSHVPYLSAPEAFRPKWARRMAEVTPADARLKVGIVWAGNPDHYNDKHRSTTLSQFGALAKVPGAVFYSLQKGTGPEEQLKNPPAGMNLVNLSPEIASFSDTAAIIEHLDLVIAVDTSVVHLAGAMGIPVWMAIPVANDFRWMRNRTDSPWYPTMRIFRQSSMDDYASTFAEIAAELERYADDPALWQVENAREKFEAGERDRAKVQLLALTRRFAGDTRVVNMLGEFFWADGNVRDALEMFLAALKLNQGDRKSIANCAQVLNAFGQKDDARALYLRYVAAHPEDSEFKSALADLDAPALAAA